jgi:hypothetical protein
MKLFSDSDELTPIRWYWADKDAELFPGYTMFGSRLYMDRPSDKNNHLGEVGKRKYDKGVNKGGLKGTCYLGDLSKFKTGLTQADKLNPPEIPDGCRRKYDPECGNPMAMILCGGSTGFTLGGLHVWTGIPVTFDENLNLIEENDDVYLVDTGNCLTSENIYIAIEATSVASGVSGLDAGTSVYMVGTSQNKIWVHPNPLQDGVSGFQIQDLFTNCFVNFSNIGLGRNDAELIVAGGITGTFP